MNNEFNSADTTTYGDIYSDYFASGHCDEYLDAMENQDQAEELRCEGIGLQLTSDFLYSFESGQFESGQLLEDVSFDAEDMAEKDYALVCEMANNYAAHVKDTFELRAKEAEALAHAQ
jgi:hypothetical protein